FNLSSWAERTQPLSQWLVEELNIRYTIPKNVGQTWVNNDELILLLDGLDEVRPAAREVCVEAINRFRQEHMMPLVICCRISEYKELTTKLRLQDAILL